MPRYFPSSDEFQQIAKTHDLIPVYRQLLGDHLTPVTAFEVLGRDEHAFLLESVVGGDRIGRYSFIATGPSAIYFVLQGKAAIITPPYPPKEFETKDPLADLEKLLPKRKYHYDKHLPAFTGGLVGFAGYDTIRYYEGEQLPNRPRTIDICLICSSDSITSW
jgi:anthranilate synthase component 1